MRILLAGALLMFFISNFFRSIFRDFIHPSKDVLRFKMRWRYGKGKRA